MYIYRIVSRVFTSKIYFYKYLGFDPSVTFHVYEERLTGRTTFQAMPLPKRTTVDHIETPNGLKLLDLLYGLD